MVANCRLLRQFPLILIVFTVSCSVPKETPPSPPGTAAAGQPTVRPARQEKARRSWDLEHTRLELRPRWEDEELDGKATLYLHPHFYPTDSIALDAKVMRIHRVARLRDAGDTLTLPFQYDDRTLSLRIDTTFTRTSTLRLYIEYTARPELIEDEGSTAIRGEKGLYFINADGKHPYKPTQLWTQGETTSNSVWFPTIEAPNQRMTQEIYLTVDTSFVTLANGLLLHSKLHQDGTRTDYWKQSLPAPPYLTMIAAGRWSVVREAWKGREISYYVDPPYAPYAKQIFGATPAMLDFFSDLLGVPFPWEKYAQVCVHDFVSGAMENTTAVVHGTDIEQDPRQALDYDYTDYIAHEAFHHWFGNLVTAASWGEIVMNEGFCNYSEYLWREHAYGRDDAERLHLQDLSGYLVATAKNDPPLVRYDYTDPDDMFDAVSYNKGGRVLHMLRRQIGDEAFFLSLRLYLQRFAFGNAEAVDYRRIVEEVTGEDLQWFFEQWFHRGGRPVLEINYRWEDSLQTMTVTVEQTQNTDKSPVYRLPTFIDIHTSGGKRRHPVVLDQVRQEFRFRLEAPPLLVNVDPEKSLLCVRRDQKPAEWYPYQFAHAGGYYDRWEAVTKLGERYDPASAGGATLLLALQDPYWRIRSLAVEQLAHWMKQSPDTVVPLLKSMATRDPESSVREAAWKMLKKHAEFDDYREIVPSGLRDSSYRVSARVFELLTENDAAAAANAVPALEKDSGNAVMEALSAYFAKEEGTDRNAWFAKALRCARGYARYGIVSNYGKYLALQEDTRLVRNGVDALDAYATNARGRFTRSSVLATFRTVLSATERRSEKLQRELASLRNAAGTTGIEQSRRERELAESRELTDLLKQRIASLENR